LAWITRRDPKDAFISGQRICLFRNGMQQKNFKIATNLCKSAESQFIDVKLDKSVLGIAVRYP
jgi:hypothetical protein